MAGGPTPPLSVIESWTHNYDNPATRGPGLEILVILLLVLAYLVVAMRLWARLVTAKNAGLDDALIVFNMIPLTALAIVLILSQRKFGFNKHVWDLHLPTLIASRKIALVLESLYILSTSVTKVSVLLFYRRLGSGAVAKTFIHCVYAAIAFVVAYFFIFTITLLLGCRPLAAFWLKVDPRWAASHAGKYTCINELANLMAAGIVSVIQDFLSVGLPMVLFWHIRLPKKQKMLLGLIFGLGFFLCITGVLRIYYSLPLYTSTYDMTWESYPAWIWMAIESHFAVVVASGPALNIFFRRTMPVSKISSPFASRKQSDGDIVLVSPLRSHQPRKGSTGSGKLGLWDVAIDEETGVNLTDRPRRIP